ncbi:MAG: hypothetical protein ACRDP6_16580 [Actinoallomurus sp.]
MTRMIERWFPCTEVSAASKTGWGSGNVESSLWVWFAKRPTVQAKAAVLTSLLPWPDEEAEQEILRGLVRRALKGHGAAQDEIAARLEAAYPGGAKVLDPFSGRAMIPLEAGRLGVHGFGIDYSPFATLGGWLLAGAAFTDWRSEPPPPFGNAAADPVMVQTTLDDLQPPSAEDDGIERDRLVTDVELVLNEVGRRYAETMADFYPRKGGQYPWGYLWASTLPCQECGNRFPLVGELRLRLPQNTRKHGFIPGQSFRIEADRATGEFHIVVHEGDPTGSPTRVLAGRHKYDAEGKVAVCPFCGHTHAKAVHTRLSMEGQRRDTILVAADISEEGIKVFRLPTEEEREAVDRAAKTLSEEPPFGLLPARPHERIPAGNTRTIQSVNYGDLTYGDLCEARQTLGLVRLARAINDVSAECLAADLSADYVKALAGYATAATMRKIRRSTRGARLEVGRNGVGDIFVNQSAVTVAYDWFESGLSDGAGSWGSLANKTVTTLRNIRERAHAIPAEITRGTATDLPFPAGAMDAVVTDPPYDDMIDYSDSSDLFFVWAKRAMMTADPTFSFTMHPNEVQEKDEEIIIKRGGSPASDPRDGQHYSTLIERAYAEAERVVSQDGVVTIVFGHGDLQVWHRMLASLARAKLVLTGSWPARTEAGGGGAGSANIETTVTMACRIAPPNRDEGKLVDVERQIRMEVKKRIDQWLRSQLATTDMLMAALGPAMEVVGRYSRVCDINNNEIGLSRFLITAQRAVQEAMAVPVHTLPLNAFDDRTRFAVWWVQVHGRQLAAKSELRNEMMAAGMTPREVKNLVRLEGKGCRFVLASHAKTSIDPNSDVIDIVLAMARVYPGGIDAVGQVLATAGKAEADEQVWAVVAFLDTHLPEPDPDAGAWAGLVRYRQQIRTAARTATPRMLPRVRKDNNPPESLF